MGMSEINNNAALQAIAHGLVQGVNYRAFVLEKAHQLDLTGFVRNLPTFEDVEIIAEGKKENLEKLIIYLRQGPRYARVDGVAVTWTEPGKEFKSFVIKY